MKLEAPVKRRRPRVMRMCHPSCSRGTKSITPGTLAGQYGSHRALSSSIGLVSVDSTPRTSGDPGRAENAARAARAVLTVVQASTHQPHDTTRLRQAWTRTSKLHDRTGTCVPGFQETRRSSSRTLEDVAMYVYRSDSHSEVGARAKHDGMMDFGRRRPSTGQKTGGTRQALGPMPIEHRVASSDHCFVLRPRTSCVVFGASCLVLRDRLCVPCRCARTYGGTTLEATETGVLPSPEDRGLLARTLKVMLWI